MKSLKHVKNLLSQKKKRKRKEKKKYIEAVVLELSKK
jgi:hypothetical protein